MDNTHTYYQDKLDTLSRFYQNEREHVDRISYYLEKKIQLLKNDINKKSSKDSSFSFSPEQYKYQHNQEEPLQQIRDNIYLKKRSSESQSGSSKDVLKHVTFKLDHE